MLIGHETYPRKKDDTRRLRNTLEDTRRNGGATSYQVELASPTLASVGPLWLGFAPAFWKLPPPPLRSHLGRLLSRFDPTARIHPTRDEELEH